MQRLDTVYPGKQIVITGHSLGGALAILAAADLVPYYGRIHSIYTFGQPRIGNQQFAEWFQNLHQNTFRIVHYADVVPHMAPASTGFQHSNN